ncbi:hypothetical protein ACEPPN_002432 [Leptodophora sp. 'Broadleaf-Isolate-01']
MGQKSETEEDLVKNIQIVVRDGKLINSTITNDVANITPQVFVHGTPENEASLIAAGSGPMMKNNHRGHVQPGPSWD